MADPIQQVALSIDSATTAMTTAATNISTAATNIGLFEARYLINNPAKYPADAAAFQGVNSTLITDTTARQIVAAPAAGKALYVTHMIITNPTAAETPIITIEDNTAVTPVTLFSYAIGAASSKELVFDPPLRVTTAKALMGKADSAVGDTLVFAQGYSGTV